MTSKAKPAQAKRAALPRKSDYTKSFQKDWARLQQSGRYDMNRLKEAMSLLVANDGPLPPEWKDHPLKGSMAAFRELHVGGDFLLLYQLADVDMAVIFVRAGTHADLFNE